VNDQRVTTTDALRFLDQTFQIVTVEDLLRYFASSSRFQQLLAPVGALSPETLASVATAGEFQCVFHDVSDRSRDLFEAASLASLYKLGLINVRDGSGPTCAPSQL
jgi:hypothetical protein